MPRPSDSPFDWASDALYPAGADPWSGEPTKVDPSPGLVDTGFVPGTLARAEEMNALLRRLTEWAEYVEETTDVRTLVIPSNEFRIQTGWELRDGSTLPTPINDSVLWVPNTIANGLYRCGVTLAGRLPRDAEIRSVRVTGVCGVAGEELSIVDHVRSMGVGVIETAYPGGASVALNAGPFDITCHVAPPYLTAFPPGFSRSLRLVWNALNGAPFNGGAVYAAAIEYSHM